MYMYVQYQHRNVHMRLNNAMDQQTYKTNEWTEQSYMRQKSTNAQTEQNQKVVNSQTFKNIDDVFPFTMGVCGLND